jgi:uncharacterized membrane protein
LASDPSPWLAVFGRAHPVLLHLPIGLLVGAATLEFGVVLLRRTPPRGAVGALLLVGALTALASVGSGLVLAGERGGGADLSTHKFAAFAQTALMLLAALAAWRDRRTTLRVLLAAALVAMTVAGHTGGAMVHGRDFLLAPLQPTPVAATPPPAPASAYATLIAPILERTCAKCHRPDKDKGGLVLSTADGLRAGGDTGPTYVPGKPDDSLLLTRILLPIGHDDHMPPNDEPQPTAAELATLRLWIAAGAPFD